MDLSSKKPETIRGVGGKAKAIKSNVSVTIARGHERYSLTIPVFVILEGGDFPILIGRAGFFENFEITFKEAKKRISIKKV